MLLLLKSTLSPVPLHLMVTLIWVTLPRMALTWVTLAWVTLTLMTLTLVLAGALEVRA